MKPDKENPATAIGGERRRIEDALQCCREGDGNAVVPSAQVHAAAEALVMTSPTPKPAVPWLRQTFGLTVSEACQAITLARAARAVK
ncbi:hypothetical protein [Acuticoccus sediminis]|uniref:hypothetical protein n=1 Tax=Acuticoccus sediminis TaxID=2184697 RepID=UPI0011B93A26|nr:hypothetical protein [Acuticoccus sediminis]